jgi:hypothetical protein
MYTHINNDIKFDDSIEISKHKKKELIDDFVSNHIDRDLLKDLKTSIGSETSSEASNHSGSKTSLDTFVDNDESHLPYNPPGVNKLVIEEDKNTKNLKRIFQKNVQKIANVFKLNKPFIKPDDDIPNVDQLFSEINKSCDMIINDNIGLNIDTDIQSNNHEVHSYDSKELLYNNFNNNIIEYFDYDKTDNTIHITKTEENNDSVVVKPNTKKKKRPNKKKK